MKQMIKNLIGATLLEVAPTTYRNYVFRKHNELNWKTIDSFNVEPEILLLQYLLSKGDVFMDVGANMGLYTHMCSKYVASENIYTFEPIPKLNQKLKKMFGNIHLMEIALSDKNGSSTFKIPEVNSKERNTMGTLNVDFEEEGESGAELLEVKTQTLDSIVAEKGMTALRLLKIDVEGFEAHVLKGAQKTIRTLKPVLFIEIEQRHHQEDINNIINRVKEVGYDCYYMEIDQRKLTKLEGDVHDVQLIDFFKSQHYVNNFIFFPINKENEGLATSINEKIQQELRN